MAKVLWHGDAGCHTGFARVTHAIGERLVRDYGHELHVLAVNHNGDDFPSQLEPGKKTPMWLYRADRFMEKDTYGLTRVIEMLALEPDVVVEYNDPNFILQMLYENQFDPTRILLQMRPIISYVPCDGTNLPPEWQKIQTVTNMVSMSKYGQSQYPDSKLIYHGIDQDQFWPIAEKPITTSTGIKLKTKKDCKEVFGLEKNAFLVLRVDKNSGRKDFASTFKALVPFMKRHSDVQVHLHTQDKKHDSGVVLQSLFSREPELQGGDFSRWSLPGLADSFSGWAQEDLNALYNAADVFISTSRGEGFGLTLAEAVGPGGKLIEPQRLITVPSGEDIWLADIDAFTGALEYLYESAGARRSLGEAGVEHVRKNFSWDIAAERFDKYITALASAG